MNSVFVGPWKLLVVLQVHVFYTKEVRFLSPLSPHTHTRAHVHTFKRPGSVFEIKDLPLGLTGVRVAKVRNDPRR